jgi:hypothetical protein
MLCVELLGRWCNQCGSVRVDCSRPRLRRGRRHASRVAIAPLLEAIGQVQLPSQNIEKLLQFSESCAGVLESDVSVFV